MGKGTVAIHEDIAAFLASHADEGYRAFQAKLIPNIDAATIVGVRTPELRKFAKGLARREDAGEFLAALPHGAFEENQLHSFVIAQERDFGKLVGEIERFLPFADNWATCDQLSCRGLAANPDAALVKVRQWLESDHEYTVRFAIGVLLQLFLDERFRPRVLRVGRRGVATGVLREHGARLVFRRGAGQAAGGRRARHRLRRPRRVDPTTRPSRRPSRAAASPLSRRAACAP